MQVSTRGYKAIAKIHKAWKSGRMQKRSKSAKKSQKEQRRRRLRISGSMVQITRFIRETWGTKASAWIVRQELSKQSYLNHLMM